MRSCTLISSWDLGSDYLQHQLHRSGYTESKAQCGSDYIMHHKVALEGII